MRQALVVFAVTAGLIFGTDAVLGYEAAYEIGYGALTLMAVTISSIFLWLWSKRATPLALGMAFSWAGAAGVMGWWWLYKRMDQPAAMTGNEALFLFLSLYVVGALLHLSVVQRSIGLPGGTFVVPLVIATGLSALIHFL